MRLMYEDGASVEAGDEIQDHEGEKWIVSETIGREPHKIGSTGRIYVELKQDSDNSWTREFYPSVFGCQWVDED